MSDLGSRLKAARVARGVELREIAAVTKISVAALESLERNDYSRLPGGIFSRSFVRAYALAVGLDPDETVSEFLVELEASERDRARNARPPEITADDRAFLDQQQRALRQLRVGLIVLGVLVGGLAIYAAWVWWPDPPSETKAGETSQTPPATAPVPAAVPPPPAMDPVPPPADTAPEQLTFVFEFTSECWVALTADGTIDVRRRFGPGDRHEVTAKEEIVLNVTSGELPNPE